MLRGQLDEDTLRPTCAPRDVSATPRGAAPSRRLTSRARVFSVFPETSGKRFVNTYLFGLIPHLDVPEEAFGPCRQK